MKYIILLMLLIQYNITNLTSNEVPQVTYNYIMVEEELYTIDYIYLIDAIITVESEWYSDAYNAQEEALGYLQIRPILIKDINRIYNTNYKLNQRNDLYYNILLFLKYQQYYTNLNINNFEIMSRIWNGGPNGYKFNSTKYYWKKVKNVLDSTTHLIVDSLSLFKEFLNDERLHLII